MAGIVMVQGAGNDLMTIGCPLAGHLIHGRLDQAAAAGPPTRPRPR